MSPKEWQARRSGYDNIDLMIPAPLVQTVTGTQGHYQQINSVSAPLHVKEFMELATSPKYAPPACASVDELERKYWKNVAFNPPIYGADVTGTLIDDDQDVWNLNHLGTILDCVNEDYGVQVEGVTTSYLYFGMWKTTFPWHTEDMDLYAINYLHYGAPKFWYALPIDQGRRLERLVASRCFPLFVAVQ